MQEDLAANSVTLGAEVLTKVDALINHHTVSGARYNAQASSEVDTEVFG